MARAATRRDRHLAGDDRAGRSARTRARTIHRAVLREDARLWLLLGSSGLSVTALCALFEPNLFLKGVVVGGGVVLTGAAMGYLVLLLGGTGPLLAGEMAEQWTADNLRPMVKHGWKLANHVLFNDGDADHVMIGPGGVLVFETKWRREPWRVHGPDPDRDAAVRQVQEKARSVGLLLEPIGARPHPVVVRWLGRGSASRDASTSQVVNGTSVVPGWQLEEWALRRGRNVLSEAQVEAGWQLLAAHAEGTEKYEDEHSPVPPSLDALALRGLGAVLSAAISFVIVADVLRWTASLTAWAMVSLGLAAAGWLARSRVPSKYRMLALGAATGSLLSLLLVAAVAIQILITP